ncbi:hypothetical protein GJAV_G00169420 [Gymnothorax javanicus]|nr:hypothetical protein GJAV_G00169420 [Gymnothorax javanicus]
MSDAAQDVSARSDPIYVGRVVSAMINASGDRGVLEGRWGTDFFGGVPPTHWNGSVDILRRWNKYYHHPVKYGQCWVFAAVMCTVLRCLGIPCRPVTNYESAHDTHGNLIIDEFYSDYGVKPKESHDSVWNFHVWVEGWMRRPDLQGNAVYDGWQVLNPTPQELSDGVDCCGRAAVMAVQAGHTDLEYDLPFVFAEVNADCIAWLLMADGSQKAIFSDMKSVGQNISTKSVGSDKRLNITANYKHPEAIGISGTQSFHFITCHDDYQLKVRRNSPFTIDEPLFVKPILRADAPPPRPTEITKDIIDNRPSETGAHAPQPKVPQPKIGDFVLVKFDTGRSTKVVLGQCNETDEEDIQVSFLWSKDAKKTVFAFLQSDTCWVELSDVLEIVETPILDNRNRYIFSRTLNVAE